MFQTKLTRYFILFELPLPLGPFAIHYAIQHLPGSICADWLLRLDRYCFRMGPHCRDAHRGAAEESGSFQECVGAGRMEAGNGGGGGGGGGRRTRPISRRALYAGAVRSGAYGAGKKYRC